MRSRLAPLSSARDTAAATALASAPAVRGLDELHLRPPVELVPLDLGRVLGFREEALEGRGDLGDGVGNPRRQCALEPREGEGHPAPSRPARVSMQARRQRERRGREVGERTEDDVVERPRDGERVGEKARVVETGRLEEIALRARHLRSALAPCGTRRLERFDAAPRFGEGTERAIEAGCERHPGGPRLGHTDTGNPVLQCCEESQSSCPRATQACASATRARLRDRGSERG